MLEIALKSVAKQTFADFECFVINDEPADNEAVRQIIRSLGDERFVFFPAVANKGGNYGRNLGIARANGRYIAFLDDDDIWFSEKLEKHFETHENTDAELVFSSYLEKWLDNSGPEILVKSGPEPVYIVEMMLKGKFSIGTTSSVTLKNKGIDNLFDERLTSFQDWDAWLSIALNNPNARFKKIEEPLLYFVQHDAERTSKNIQKRKKGLNQVFEKYKHLKGIKTFYNKELFNIDVLSVSNLSPGLKKAMLLLRFIVYPPFWINFYAIKRMGKYILTAK